MGYYVNPTTGQSKEAYLAEHGRRVPLAEFVTFADFDGPELPVCLVDNGFFTAAAVGYCAGEVEAFASPDGRYKEYYMVPRTKLGDAAGLPDTLLALR